MAALEDAVHAALEALEEAFELVDNYLFEYCFDLQSKLEQATNTPTPDLSLVAYSRGQFELVTAIADQLSDKLWEQRLVLKQHLREAKSRKRELPSLLETRPSVAGPPPNMEAAMSKYPQAALKQWELENNVKLVDPSRDALYTYNSSQQKAINSSKPWSSDPHYFTSVRISSVALLKMVMHARSGGSLEVMGLMLGKIEANTFIVTDSFRLPVEGTETRVNAQDEANEYMITFLERARESGQLENAVGWYHSHPGYGCWLSGIDVGTQRTQQLYQDPFVAVVIDPDRTVSAGKVEIGAFRTYPEEYVKDKEASGKSSGKHSNNGHEGGNSAADSEGFQTIPLGKIEDFGAHANHYYSLDVTHFKSSLDTKLLEALWNKYWVGTLSASPLFSNREYGTKQISDLARKIRQEESDGPRKALQGGYARKVGKEGDNLGKLAMAAGKIQREEEMGLLAAKVKERVFMLDKDGKGGDGDDENTEMKS